MIILSWLFSLPHIPHVILLPFTQTENTIETQKVRDLLLEFTLHHKIYYFLPSEENCLSFHHTQCMLAIY